MKLTAFVLLALPVSAFSIASAAPPSTATLKPAIAAQPTVASKPAVAGKLAVAGKPAAVTAIDLNAADASTLAREMRGIGESKARAIVEYRRLHGPFRSIDDLALVKGIGARTIELNRAKLRVGAMTPNRHVSR